MREIDAPASHQIAQISIKSRIASILHFLGGA
jgi:hypothetical protein